MSLSVASPAPRPSKGGPRWSLAVNVLLILATGILFVTWRHARNNEALLRHQLDQVAANAKIAEKTTDSSKVQPYRAYGTQGWRVWIDQLRKSGVPDAVIARIAIAESLEEWDVQNQKAQARVGRGELSIKQYDDASKSSEVIQEKAVRDALGDDGYLHWDMDRVIGHLGLNDMEMTDQERAALYTIQKETAEERAELDLQQQQGLIDPTDYSALQEKEYYDSQAKIKKLLGDDRYAISQNGGDPAMELRRLLRDYKPTDEQFKKMVEAQKQWTLKHEEIDRYQPPEDEAEDKNTKMAQALDDARNEAYKKALGAVGYAAFQKQQDSRHITLQQYAPSWGLNPETVETLYGAISSFEKTMQDARTAATAKEAAGEKVDWDEVSAMEEQIKARAEEHFRSTLGPEKTFRLTKAGVLTLNSQSDQ